MKHHSYSSACVLLCIGAASMLLAGPLRAEPLLEYLFDETSGTMAANSGSLGAAGNLTFTSPAVLGPGLTTEALNNTASTGMGSGFTGGNAQTSASNTAALQSAFNNLSSITITGWFNTSSVIGNGARILDALVGTAGFDLSTVTPGKLQLYINGTNAVSSGNDSYSTLNAWEFFAVTYDSATGSVSFYYGSTGSGPVLDVTRTGVNGGLISMTNVSGIALGNVYGSNIRPLDGSLDDIQVYGATDGSGALSQSQVDAVWAADVAGVPEPPIGASLLLGGLALFGFHGLRRRAARGCRA
jgi:hypothetical protein